MLKQFIWNIKFNLNALIYGCIVAFILPVMQVLLFDSLRYDVNTSLLSLIAFMLFNYMTKNLLGVLSRKDATDLFYSMPFRKIDLFVAINATIIFITLVIGISFILGINTASMIAYRSLIVVSNLSYIKYLVITLLMMYILFNISIFTYSLLGKRFDSFTITYYIFIFPAAIYAMISSFVIILNRVQLDIYDNLLYLSPLLSFFAIDFVYSKLIYFIILAVIVTACAWLAFKLRKAEYAQLPANYCGIYKYIVMSVVLLASFIGGLIVLGSNMKDSSINVYVLSFVAAAIAYFGFQILYSRGIRKEIFKIQYFIIPFAIYCLIVFAVNYNIIGMFPKNIGSTEFVIYGRNYYSEKLSKEDLEYIQEKYRKDLDEYGFSIPRIENLQKTDEKYHDLMEYKYSKFSNSTEIVLNNRLLGKYKFDLLLTPEDIFKNIKSEKIKTFVNMDLNPILILDDDNKFVVTDDLFYLNTVDEKEFFYRSDEGEFNDEYQKYYVLSFEPTNRLKDIMKKFVREHASDMDNEDMSYSNILFEMEKSEDPQYKNIDEREYLKDVDISKNLEKGQRVNELYVVYDTIYIPKKILSKNNRLSLYYSHSYSTYDSMQYVNGNLVLE